MFDQAFLAIQPVLTELIVGGIVAYFGGVLTKIFGQDRANKMLKQAVESGLEWAWDEIRDWQTTGNVHVFEEAREKALEYVRQSVPQAINRLQVNETQIRKLIEAKLRPLGTIDDTYDTSF